MRGVRRVVLGASALLIGVAGAPAAQAAKPPAVPKTIGFVAESMTTAESDGAIWVTLQRSVTKGKASVTVLASIGAGDTAEPEDIPSAPATATFASGASQATAVLSLPNDNEHEGDETFTLSISAVPKGFVGTDTLSVQINEDDPPPPAPHAGTFTLDPGKQVVFGGFSINSCNTLTAVLERSVGAPIELGTNAGQECSEHFPTISQTVVNNTLTPITLSFILEDDDCGASYSSDHTSTGTVDDVDHALTTPAEGYHAVDIHDGGGELCDRKEDDAIPVLDAGELEIDIAFSAAPVATGIWIVPDGWTARFDQFAVWGCDNEIKAHLVVDGVDTYTLDGVPDGGGCYFDSDNEPAALVNSSGETKLVQFVLEDVTCGVRYSSSHTSTGSTSVDHTMIWGPFGVHYQVAITHAGAGCANEDATHVPGIGDGNFTPFIDVYQTSF